MCFEPSLFRGYKVRVAKKDIPVIKLVEKDRYTEGGNVVLHSPFNYFVWERGKTYNEPSFMTAVDNARGEGDVLQENGFHSCRTERYASKKMREWGISANCFIVQMVIPKGTRYLRNRKEYFSESLKFPY